MKQGPFIAFHLQSVKRTLVTRARPIRFFGPIPMFFMFHCR